MSSADPGGGPPDFNVLKENFNQQQAKIAALKELVKSSDRSKSTANTQEKVKNIAQRLTHLKSKAVKSRQNLSDETDNIDEIMYGNMASEIAFASGPEHQLSLPPNISRAKSETPGSEKIQLLRQQMEENRQKMAERAHNKKGIEDMVTQMKAKLDITQMSLEKSTELGKSIGDLSAIGFGSKGALTKSSSDLNYATVNFDKERMRNMKRKIIDLESKLKEKDNFIHPDINTGEHLKKIKTLENRILDLEENLKEKESIIDARTRAVSLMSENLSLKGKNTVDMLEDTKQEMLKMQENFIKVENDYKSDNEVLRIELEESCCKLNDYEEKVKILEKNRFDLTMKNSELEGKLNDVLDYSTKLSELNKQNEALLKRIHYLENQKYDIITDDEIAAAKSASIVENEESLDTNNSQIEALQHEVLKLREKISFTQLSDSELLEKCQSLESENEKYRLELNEFKEKYSNLEESLSEKTIEYNVLQANFSVLEEKLNLSAPKPLFSKSTDEEAELEISKLKSQLDESNKSSIKTKLKLKQLQKQIDNLKKSSTIHEEIVRLTEDNQSLHHKIIELEEEKGQLQLKLVHDDSTRIVTDTDLENKITVLEHTCQNQTSAINLLEEQKIDMTENLQKTKEELTTLKEQIKEIDDQETTRVSIQYSAIELEEKLEQYKTEISELSITNNSLKKELDDLEVEKNRYVLENTELLDKIDKLSVEKGSSNESIEIVANLTQQEKLEIEEFNKTQDVESNLDLNDSLVKLREESSELMHKIELFTTERKEVLEKMELISVENSKLKRDLESLEKDKIELLEKLHSIKVIEVKEVVEVEEKIEVMKKSDDGDSRDITFNDENYVRSLKLLENELESYKRNKEKNTKLKQFKKFASEAQKVHNLLNELLIIHRSTKHEMHRLESEYSVAKQQLATFDVKVKEIEELKLKVSQVSERDEALYNAEIERLKFSVEDKDAIIQALMHEIEEYKSKHSLSEDHVKNLEKISENLEKELESLKTASEEKDVAIKTLNSKLYENKSSESSFEDHVKDLERTVNDLTKQLTFIKNENINHVNTIDEQLTALKTKNEQLESLEETNNKLNETIREFESKTRELENLKEINSKLNEAVRDSETLTYNLRNEFEIRLKSFDEQSNILKLLVAEQKQQLIDAFTDHEKELSEKILQIELYENKIDKLKKELSQNAQNNDVVDNLRTMLDKQEEELHYKQETIDSLNNQIIELYRTIENNTNQMLIHQDELQDLASQKSKECEDLKAQLIKNKKEKDVLENEMQERIREIENLKENASSSVDQSSKIRELEISLAELDAKNKEQLDKLKKFAANLKKKVAQCNELELKLANHETNSPESIINLNELKNERELLQLKYNEKAQFCTQLEQEINILKLELSKSNESTQNSSSDNENINQLNGTIVQLREESAMALQTISSLQNQLFEIKSVHDVEINKRENSLNMLENEIEKLNGMITEKDNLLELNKNELNTINEKIKEADTIKDDLKNKNLKIEKCKAVIKEKIKEINRLNATCGELNQQIEILNARQQQQIIDNDSTDKNRIEQLSAKVEENMLYIETIESENTDLKYKIEKLENELRNVEEFRSTLESESTIFKQSFEEKISQHIQNECEFNEKLLEMNKHNENCEKQINSLQIEKTDLYNMVETTKQINDELNKRIVQQQNHLIFIENEKLPEVEKEKQTLFNNVESLKIELKRVHTEFENKLHDKSREFDDAELNYEQQIECMRKDNRNLEELLEKVRDESSFLKDEVVQLKDSIHLLEQVKSDIERELTWTKLQNETLAHDQLETQELRMQVVQDQTEIENLRSQNQILLQNYEIEVNDLKKQLAELDSMNLQVGQNQTDDQVMLQHENNKLRDLLHEKEMEIEQYHQRQNSLQQASTSSIEGHELLSSSDQNLREIALESSLREKDIEINDLRIEIADLQRNMIRQSSQQEIDAVVAVAEEHVRALQQNINTETVANMRHKYENDIKMQEKQLATLQSKLDEQENYIKELEEKYKNLHILREESLKQLANKTKISDELKASYLIAQQQIYDLENQIDTVKPTGPASSQHTVLSNTVPSFDSSMFFGQATPSIFDEPIVAQTSQPLAQQQIQKAEDHFHYGTLNQQVQQLTLECNNLSLENKRINEELTALQNYKTENEVVAQMQANDRENMLCSFNELKSKLDETLVENENMKYEIINLRDNSTKPGTSDNNSVFQPVSKLFESKTKNLFDSVNDVDEFDDIYKNRVPVEEPVCSQSSAYVCGPDQEGKKLETMEVLFDDQSWGWEADQPQSLENIEIVNKSNASTAASYIDYEKTIEILQSENSNLQQSLSNLQEQYSNQMSTAEVDNKRFVDEINYLHTERQRLLNLQEQFNNHVAAIETDKKQLEDEIIHLSTEKKSISNLREHFYNQISEIEANKKTLENELNQLQTEKESLINVQYQLNNHIGTIEADKKLLEDETKNLHIVQNNLETNLCDLRIEIENMLLTKENHNVEFNKLQDEIRAVRLEAENLKLIIEEKDRLLDQMRSTNTKLPENKEILDHKNESGIPAFVGTSFFGQSSSDDFNIDPLPENQIPVTEEIITPKSSYTCGPPEDEGWGWGSNEAILEEQHQKSTSVQSSSLIEPSAQFELKIQDLEDKVQVLELEKSRLEDEVVALKVKSGKLIKRLKECKTKSESNVQLKQLVSTDSSDLDLAIQEELNITVKNLETKVAEFKAEIEKRDLERQKHIQRIDVLTAVNDRMTEMKDRQDSDIEMYTYKIRELTVKLQQMEEWGDENYNKESPQKLSNDGQESSNNIEEMNNRIKQLTSEINDLRNDNEELQAILDEQRENNKVFENKIAHYGVLTRENSDLKEELSKTSLKLHEKIDENNNNLIAINALNETNSTLSNEIERMKTASLFQSPEFTASVNPFGAIPIQNESEKLAELEQENQNLSAQINYKNIEIQQLNKKIDEIVKEDQTQSLVQEILTKNHEINLLKTQVQTLESDKIELENNLSLQLTQEEIVSLRKEIDNQSQTISALQSKLCDMESEKMHTENELKILNDKVLESFTYEDKMKAAALELDVKNIEISELKNTLGNLQFAVNNEKNLQSTQDTNNQLYELENKWKQYVLDRETHFNATITTLEQEINNLKQQLNEKISSIDKPSTGEEPNVNSEILKNMQVALENQELEIVTLKEQLAIRCAEYARLASQVDPFAQLSSSSSLTAKISKPNSERKISASESIASSSDASDVVPRGELDLALYMLHQRDMRCEELTFELMNLLEERDTLQLKLSNSIRQLEEIKRKSGLSDDSENDDVLVSKVEDTIESQGTSSRFELPKTSDLKNKITQLHAASNSRDKTLQEDREKRQRQFIQLQKDISNIPSEAVSQLVGTDYTLSRTSQSPSAVLFNWLMGKSTPKEPQ